jgi:hypothetical protein
MKIPRKLEAIVRIEALTNCTRYSLSRADRFMDVYEYADGRIYWILAIDGLTPSGTEVPAWGVSIEMLFDLMSMHFGDLV